MNVPELLIPPVYHSCQKWVSDSNFSIATKKENIYNKCVENLTKIWLLLIFCQIDQCAALPHSFHSNFGES